MRKRFTVAKGQASDLISFVATAHAGSKKAAKRLLDSRAVFVNGVRLWMAKHQLAIGDLVEVVESRPSSGAPVSLSIVFSTPDFICVNKPAGILSDGKGETVEALVKNKMGNSWCAIHRLDRDTTGCLLFAGSKSIKEKFIDLFRGKDIKKVYHALVYGLFPPEVTSITKPIDGKSARSEVEILSATTLGSHVAVTIITGRMHQVRKHLASFRHPVIGDKEYNGSEVIHPQLRAIDRQMLHARVLAFASPIDGTPVRIEAPFPADFRRTLELLESMSG